MAQFTRPHGPTLCFEQTGARRDEPIVLIHGIGCQLIHWPASLVEALAAAHLRVIRLDNRDMGLSASLDDLGLPDLSKVGEADFAPPYRLHDMAADVVALLDHLGLAAAHIVGVSLGGMIAQRMAIEHADRVLSLTSIMSSSGNPTLPSGTDEAMAMLTTPPPSNAREDVIRHSIAASNVIGGPHYLSEAVGMAREAAAAYDRKHNPAGFARQFAAASADRNRWEALSSITAPTLVIHGLADPLVPPAAGEDTAARIPGARLTLVERMGHDLPEPLVPELATAIVGHLRQATSAG